MSSRNRYDLTVATLYGLSPVPGEIGCEIEVEGTRLPHVFINAEGNRAVDMRYHWATHADGSLRTVNPGDLAVEYVLRKPNTRKEFQTSLDYFAKKWAEAEATSYDTYRQSVHVHLNVSSWPMRRVYSFLTAYYILEEVLVDFADGGTKTRVANRFCLRAKDSEDILMQLQRLIKTDFRGRISADQYKYGACNIAAMSQYGSLEFRSLRGTVDTTLIKTWTDLLLAIKDYAEKFDNPNEVIADFSEMGPQEWAQKVFSQDQVALLWSDDFNQKLRDGMRLAQDVGFATYWEPYKVVEVAPKKQEMTSEWVVYDEHHRPMEPLGIPPGRVSGIQLGSAGPRDFNYGIRL